MNKGISIFPFLILLLLSSIAIGQDSKTIGGAKVKTKVDAQTEDYWRINNERAIVWDLTIEKRLPHHGNIEMAGLKVASIIYYAVDEDKKLTIERDVIFPQLRTYNKSDQPDWKKYRAYYRKRINDDILPSITVGNKTIVPGPLDSISINGMMTFYHAPVEGLQITRIILPSPTERYIVEEWEITNVSKIDQSLQFTNCELYLGEKGYKGDYAFYVKSEAPDQEKLYPGQSINFPIYYGATLELESSDSFNDEKAIIQRVNYLSEIDSKLILETPDPIINQLFYFSKLRAAESIFSSSMGTVHSPGGGNYYVGIWANDQIEYSGPFFPYLGYALGNQAAENAYRHFQKNIPESGHIPYAFEVDGNFPMTHLDRGDAAMIAYGTTHYLLARGDKALGSSLWPLVEWSLNYCHHNRNSDGAVLSESDEMEGRITTGKANLSTSSLYYGGLKYASRLADALSKKAQADIYRTRQEEMGEVIENYFGATIEGLETYKYFEENTFLRHWICLPLSMGITDRKEGTIEALLDKLWTDNGILVELNPASTQNVFWDRATLYALQGIFKVGESDKGYEKLLSLSRKRLLGDHVPYVVEAYPENNMKHLSAESALYCRIITEGMLGIEPVSFDRFIMTPTLPSQWDFMRLRNMTLLDRSCDIELTRKQQDIRVVVRSSGKTILDKLIKSGEEISITL